jgi:hypothetical protein
MRKTEQLEAAYVFIENRPHREAIGRLQHHAAFGRIVAARDPVVEIAVGSVGRAKRACEDSSDI